MKTRIALGVAALTVAAGCQHRAHVGVGPAMARAEQQAQAQAAAEAGPADVSTTPPFATPPMLASAPDVATLAARVKPCVVNITTTHEVRRPRIDVPIPFGFRSPDEDSVRRATALGTGFVVDTGAHVVTNAHVVEGASTVKVRLSDDRELDGIVKGKDDRLDLAVLELKGATDLPNCALGDSEKLKVGEYVVAVGNPFGLGHTVTMGIVSAKGRAIGAGPYDDFIQTDAAINPGNSGGPLFNLNGQVVGINTAINPSGKGIGFAIPIDDLKSVLPQILAKGHVERGRLGVVAQPVDAALAKAMGLDRARGALVAEVEAGGPADRAGVKAGDLIVAVGGQEVAHSEELPRMIAKHAPGETVNVKLLRDGREVTVDVALAAIQDKREARGEDRRHEAAPSSALGIRVADSPGEGVVVAGVVPGGAAEGVLRPGDVILEVNRRAVTSAADLGKRVSDAPKDQPLLFKVKREGTTRFVAIQR